MCHVSAWKHDKYTLLLLTISLRKLHSLQVFLDQCHESTSSVWNLLLILKIKESMRNHGVLQIKKGSVEKELHKPHLWRKQQLGKCQINDKNRRRKETLLSGQFHRQAIHEIKRSLYTHHPDFQSSSVGHAPPLPPSPVRRLPYAWKHCGVALLPCAHAVIQWMALTLIIMLKYLWSMNF